MKPRMEMPMRPSHLEAVPDPVNRPEKFKLFSIKDELRKTIQTMDRQTSLRMSEITDDIVDIVAISRINIVDAIDLLDRAKQDVSSSGENLLAVYRRLVQQLVDKK